MQAINALDQREAYTQDTDTNPNDTEQQNECTTLKGECIRQLRSLMSRTHMYTTKDFALEERGVDHFAQTLQKEELEKNLQFISRTSERLTQTEQSFRRDISTAKDSKWITPKTAEHWIKKLHSSKYNWWEKVNFVENKFPRLMANWQNLSSDIKDIKEAVKKNPDLISTPEIETVLKKGGRIKTYKDWRSAVDAATALLSVNKDPKLTDMYKDAKMRLEVPLKLHATTSQKTNKWLKRIFSSNAKPEEIHKFVYGKLGELTANWIQEKKRYDEIESERKKQGTPRSFHFVSLNVFLGYNYNQKRSYNNVAEQSIKRKHPHPIITEIKREVAAKDWATVEHLVSKAKMAKLSETDKWELGSLKEFIACHRPTNKTEEEQVESGKETREEVEEDLQQVLGELHPTLAHLTNTFIRNDTYDTVRAYLAAVYNFGWSHKHLYLNPNVLEELREDSKEETKYVQQNGDLGEDKMENLDVDALDDKSMASLTDRKYGEGTEAATYLHIGRQNHDSFRRMCKQNARNERWKYWVIVDFKEVPYRDQLHCATNMRHKIKSIKRRWDKTTTKSSTASTKKSQKAASAFAMAG